jgi:hypothetical protein
MTRIKGKAQAPLLLLFPNTAGGELAQRAKRGQRPLPTATRNARRNTLNGGTA